MLTLCLLWCHQVTMAQGTSSNVGVPLRQGLFNDYTSDLYNINFKPLVRKPHHDNVLKWLVGTGPWQRKMQRLLGTGGWQMEGMMCCMTTTSRCDVLHVDNKHSSPRTLD